MRDSVPSSPVVMNVDRSLQLLNCGSRGRNETDRSGSSSPRGVGILTSFITLRLTPRFPVDAFLRLSFGISLLLVRIARCAVMTGFASATDTHESKHSDRSNLPQLTLHA